MRTLAELTAIVHATPLKHNVNLSERFEVCGACKIAACDSSRPDCPLRLHMNARRREARAKKAEVYRSKRREYYHRPEVHERLLGMAADYRAEAKDVIQFKINTYRRANKEHVNALERKAYKQRKLQQGTT